MINNCGDCKTNCCKSGPGPYKIVTAKEAVEHWGMTRSYNTKCQYLSRAGNCNVWGTSDLPIECATYVCHVREYSKKQINYIQKLEHQAWLKGELNH